MADEEERVVLLHPQTPTATRNSSKAREGFSAHGRFKSSPPAMPKTPTPHTSPLRPKNIESRRNRMLSLVRRRLLVAADVVLSLTVFNWANAAFWRGIWGLQRGIFPGYPLASSIISIILGALLGVAMSLPSSSRSPPSRLAQQWGNLLSGVGVVCTWRGTWTLIQHTLDIRESRLAFREGDFRLLLVGIVCFALLLCVRQTNVLLTGPPFSLCTDVAGEKRERATIFSQHVKLYLLGLDKATCPLPAASLPSWWPHSLPLPCLRLADLAASVWLTDVLSVGVWICLDELCKDSQTGGRPGSGRVYSIPHIYAMTLLLFCCQWSLLSAIRKLPVRLRVACEGAVNLLACFLAGLHWQVVNDMMESAVRPGFETSADLVAAILGCLVMLQLGVTKTVGGGDVAFDGDGTKETYFDMWYLTLMDEGKDKTASRAALLERKSKSVGEGGHKGPWEGPTEGVQMGQLRGVQGAGQLVSPNRPKREIHLV